jgi:two-component system, cell cycle response regulator
VNNDIQQDASERIFPRSTLDPVSKQPAQQVRAETAPTLKLFVYGLSQDERQLLEGLVRVSQRRSPRLMLLDERDAQGADVVLIDSNDTDASAWARRHRWLDDRAVIWIDAIRVASGHTLIRRPVQWSILPMLLARALEQSPGTAAAFATSRAAPLDLPNSINERPRPILVVDDSLAVRAHLRSLLEAGGFVVSESDSAQAALALLARQSFDCVLMDVMMPGIDGYEGCRQIKAMLRGARALPVVMLTSKSSPFDRIRGKMAGCDAYLTKPVDPKQLGEVLVQQLHAMQ